MTKRLLPALLLTLTPFVMAPAAAQDAAQGGSRRSKPAAVTVSLDFRGGTLSEFVAAVRAVQAKANIVLATGARAAKVPPLTLNSAGIEQALEGACMAVEFDQDVRVKEFRGNGEPVYSIVAYSRPMSGAQVGRPRTAVDNGVYSLNELTDDRAPYIDGVEVATVLSAIELALADEEHAPRIRYHEDSGLLLARGTLAQLDTIEQTLRVIERDLEQRERRARTVQKERRRSASDSATNEAREAKAGKDK